MKLTPHCHDEWNAGRLNRLLYLMSRYEVVTQESATKASERHIVVGTCMPTEWSNTQWCMFHEVPGPGKDESEGATVVARISYAERNL